LHSCECWLLLVHFLFEPANNPYDRAKRYCSLKSCQTFREVYRLIATLYSMVGILITTLLRIYRWSRRWNNLFW